MPVPVKYESVCASSPARWRVWTMPGCRPGSRCRCSAALDPSKCSRNAGSGRRCPRLTPAARAGGGTRRWPSQPPGDRCTAARGAGWSCSIPAADQEGTGGRTGPLSFSLRLHKCCTAEDKIKATSNVSVSHLVVVAPGGKMLVVRRPFKTTHFLPVTLQPPLSRRGRPDVPLQDHSVPAS